MTLLLHYWLASSGDPLSFWVCFVTSQLAGSSQSRMDERNVSFPFVSLANCCTTYDGDLECSSFAPGQIETSVCTMV